MTNTFMLYVFRRFVFTQVSGVTYGFTQVSGVTYGFIQVSGVTYGSVVSDSDL